MYVRVTQQTERVKLSSEVFKPVPVSLKVWILFGSHSLHQMSLSPLAERPSWEFFSFPFPSCEQQKKKEKLKFQKNPKRWKRKRVL